MNSMYSALTGKVGRGRRRRHASTGAPTREGIVLGVIMATTTWAWVATIDVFAGAPFQAFTVMGGVVLFTVMHFLLNIIYGVVIVSAIRGAARAPSLIIALVFGFVMIEIAFAMVTVLLSNIGLGSLAWLRIFGGSLVGGMIAIAVLSRRHALLAQLRKAEAEM